MKRLSILIIVILYGLRSFALSLPTDSVAKQQSTTLTTNIDTLKRMLLNSPSDTLKSAIYAQLFTQYLNYDKLDNRTKSNFQTQALYYTYEDIHLCSRMNDSVGLRNCFNSLAKIYRSQHKYPQAKWFVIQSNALSRSLKDVPNVMSSLMLMANIKMEMKDYSLAMRDLDEALKISKNIHSPKDEAKIQDSYVLLYTHFENYTKSDIAAKRRDFINDSLLKDEQQLVVKTQDSLQVKKKVPVANKKSIKTNYTRRIASL